MGYKLVPELVPLPLWGISAYRALGRSTPWKKIRQDTLESASHKCQSCGSRKPLLSCHDKWRYDDKKRVAKLIGFEIRCALCHLATHIGRAAAIGYEKEAMQQLRKVNRCTKKEVDLMIEIAMLEWRVRSSKKWAMIVAPKLLKRYQRLASVTLSASKTARLNS
jgi:hypothetical protein